MLMNLADVNWDDQMLKLLDVPRCMLPEIRPSSGDFGSTSTELFGKSIPITGVAGDQHAALFGHGAFSSGDVKNTYGTGCFTLMNVGDKPVYSRDGLLSTVAWKIGGNTVYALEGSVFMAGAVLQWLRDGLDLIQDVREAAEWAGKAADNGGVYLVPAFQGLGTPWWATEAKAVLSGLTRASTKSHVCRAFLESIAYRSRDVIDTMLKGCGGTMHHMKVDGGASRSDFLMQFQADILKIPVQRSHTAEVTALGAAMLAGLGVGLWENIETLQTLSGNGGTFEPRMPEEKRRSLYEGWLNAVGNVVS